jgi:hypothetical protein
MHPHPWIVEFAIREEREREQRAMRQADRDNVALPGLEQPQLAHRWLRTIGRLLVSVGESLDRFGSAETWQPNAGGPTTIS